MYNHDVSLFNMQLFGYIYIVFLLGVVIGVRTGYKPNILETKYIYDTPLLILNTSIIFKTLTHLEANLIS